MVAFDADALFVDVAGKAAEAGVHAAYASENTTESVIALAELEQE